jgi:hypothetical protein
MEKNQKGIESEAMPQDEDKIASDYLDAMETSHRKVSGDISDRLKLTLTLRQIILIIIVLSTIGRATSGRWWFDYRQASQVRRLSDENNRLDNEINMVRLKMGHRNESILIYRGILENRDSLLEQSRMANKQRSEPFEFVNWSRPDDLVEAMFQLEAWECLQWVMRQPKWYSCLNAETYKNMTEFSQKLNAKELQTAAKNEHGK